MDPSTNLKEQLYHAEEIVNSDFPLAEDATRLAELVLALNEWITRGGFLPSAWTTQIGETK
jgi:hypothetical protein